MEGDGAADPNNVDYYLRKTTMVFGYNGDTVMDAQGSVAG